VAISCKLSQNALEHKQNILGLCMQKQKVSLIITDLDNTLFDWVDIWYRCFSAMFAEVQKISGLPSEDLIPEIREIHQRHATSEYAFLIEEIPSLRRMFPNSNLIEVFAPAIKAFREARRAHLNLFPQVAETLLKIKGKGAAIVGYTESLSFYSNYRVRRLGLDGVIDAVYSPRDHGLPAGMRPKTIRRYSESHYNFKYTKEKHTPKGELKPNPDILRSIIKGMKVPLENCVYLGDSLFKDVAMAKEVGITAVWASYGVAQSRAEYELLREVTHWSADSVQIEKDTSDANVTPDYVLKASIAEIMDIFDFVGLSK
jgi:FMN phosphatase YigB (HAD superfamily)